MSDGVQILSDEQIQAIIMSFGEARRRQNKMFTEEEATALVSWAEDAVINKDLLDSVLEGSILLDVNDEGEPLFSFSESGKEEMDKILVDKVLSMPNPFNENLSH